MNNEFFDALELLEKEKGIPMDYLLERIKTAIGMAVKRDYGGIENVLVDISDETRKFKVSIVKNVVEEVEDPVNEITLEDALKHDKRAKVGDTVEIKLETKQFGRIAAQTAKHVIRQGIREAEREQMIEQFRSKLHEVVTGKVQRVEPQTGNVTLEIDHNEVMLFRNEQLETDEFVEGDFVKVYVSDIVASEAGSRSKLAVYSADENVDAVGACIGPKGARVARIVDELGGEKIDVVRYSDDPKEFISQALSPATVVGVEILDEEARTCRVTVPDHQLSLAIGNKGQNAKLAARLTGYKIDIRPESGFYGEEE